MKRAKVGVTLTKSFILFGEEPTNIILKTKDSKILLTHNNFYKIFIIYDVQKIIINLYKGNL